MDSPPRLRRELGPIEAYATLIGILVGAGIFRVTSDASAATGAGVVLGHLVLAPAVLASTVAYSVFLSTPLGREPGGEALHLARTFNSPALGFVAAWLKLVSYLGAGAYLATALVEQLAALCGTTLEGFPLRLATLGALAVFLLLHLRGSRAFAKAQVWMCLVLALAILALVLPGLFAIRAENLTPFLPNGTSGFIAALPPLFFAYAGFESLAQTAGEVEDSTRRLPPVFFRGVALTTTIFVGMSLVAFGAVPAAQLQNSVTPMTDAARTFLPGGAHSIVTIGAIMAVATSVNATMLVPARLCYGLANEGLMPKAFASVHAERNAPRFGIFVSFALVAALVLSGQAGIALGIAVMSLVLLYGLHSVALLALPRTNPALFAQVQAKLPRSVQIGAASISAITMAVIVGAQVSSDLKAGWNSATVLLLAWAVVGITVYRIPWRRS